MKKVAENLKKCKERMVLREFLDVYCAIKKINIDEFELHSEKYEPPDGFAIIGGKKIGVELVRYVNKKYRENHGFVKNCLDLARNKLFEESDPFFSKIQQLDFGFLIEYSHIGKIGEEQAVNSLVDFIKRNIKSLPHENCISTGLNFFSGITVKQGTGEWKILEVRFGEYSNIGEINDLIKAKSEDLPRWKGVWDARWLLVYDEIDDGLFPHSAISSKCKVIENTFESVFIFFCRAARKNEIIELTIK